MRSFLIRDILSGSAAAAAAAAAAGPQPADTTTLVAADQLAAAAAAAAAATSGGASSFDAYAAAQSLAVSQARFLAKLAEHQQQVQAGKYYEQLQQQQHADQLLTFSQHQHQLQQLQQLQQLHQQHQQLQRHLHQSQPASTAGALAVSLVGGPNLLAQTGPAAAAMSAASLCSSQATSAHSSGSSSSAVVSQCAQPNSLKGPAKRQKLSSFTYDCSSPITSISDCGADQEEEEEDEDEAADADEEREDRDDEKHQGGKLLMRVNPGANGRNDEVVRDDEVADEVDEDDDDNDDGEEVDIEVVERRAGGVGSSRPASSLAEHAAQLGSAASSHARLLQAQGPGSDRQQQQQLAAAAAQFQHPLNSPLDALFQMTSNTFDSLKRGDKRPRDRDSEQQASNNFSNKQSSKKKRKSRTAFTNNQIYELERRFRMQKYLSPTDRDEIAMTLHLSNAQVITWFQNRRAKLKRDLEEQKRDIETANLMSMHKSFLDSLQMLNQMKSVMKPELGCRMENTTTPSTATTTSNTTGMHTNSVKED